MTDTDIIKFLESMPETAPLALRDFDCDPRFAGKYPSAVELWHKRQNEIALDRAIEADAFLNK
jgi:hypothetical protein